MGKRKGAGDTRVVPVEIDLSHKVDSKARILPCCFRAERREGRKLFETLAADGRYLQIAVRAPVRARPRSDDGHIIARASEFAGDGEKRDLRSAIVSVESRKGKY